MIAFRDYASDLNSGFPTSVAPFIDGNALFTHDRNSLYSPVGNRVSVFDFVKCVRLPWFVFICLSSITFFRFLSVTRRSGFPSKIGRILPQLR